MKPTEDKSMKPTPPENLPPHPPEKLPILPPIYTWEDLGLGYKGDESGIYVCWDGFEFGGIFTHRPLGTPNHRYFRMIPAPPVRIGEGRPRVTDRTQSALDRADVKTGRNEDLRRAIEKEELEDECIALETELAAEKMDKQTAIELLNERGDKLRYANEKIEYLELKLSMWVNAAGRQEEVIASLTGDNSEKFFNWSISKKDAVDRTTIHTTYYSAMCGPVNSAHVISSPSVIRWLGSDELVEIKPERLHLLAPIKEYSEWHSQWVRDNPDKFMDPIDAWKGARETYFNASTRHSSAPTPSNELVGATVERGGVTRGEIDALRALMEIHHLTDGWADGAPDAGNLANLCNEISAITREALRGAPPLPGTPEAEGGL